MEIWQLQMVLREYISMKNGTTFFKKFVQKGEEEKNESKLGILQRI